MLRVYVLWFYVSCEAVAAVPASYTKSLMVASRLMAFVAPSL
jgi:hypothetical protein